MESTILRRCPVDTPSAHGGRKIGSVRHRFHTAGDYDGAVFLSESLVQRGATALSPEPQTLLTVMAPQPRGGQSRQKSQPVLAGFLVPRPAEDGRCPMNAFVEQVLASETRALQLPRAQRSPPNCVAPSFRQTALKFSHWSGGTLK